MAERNLKEVFSELMGIEVIVSSKRESLNRRKTGKKVERSIKLPKTEHEHESTSESLYSSETDF